jgi:hypothetical protein
MDALGLLRSEELEREYIGRDDGMSLLFLGMLVAELNRLCSRTWGKY